MEERILQELKNYETSKNRVAMNILNELKKDCSTYSDLENKLRTLQRNITYKQEDREKFSTLINSIYQLLEKEKSDLPVANHLM